MDARECVKRTLEFDSPERIPRQIWILPWADAHHPETVKRLRRRFPDDIVAAPAVYTKPVRTQGNRYMPGTYVDEWGCRFSSVEEGIIGIVREPLIRDWTDLDRFAPPESVLSIDTDAVNSFCRESDRFVLSGTTPRPFERLGFLRTMEQAMMDLVTRPPELFTLLDRIHDLYLKEIEVWSRTDVDAVTFMDDWGTQRSMMVHPRIWRSIFKPIYRDYVEMAHRHGKYIFMHSDGYITDIIPDLVEIGVDALNSQVHCMGVAELGAQFAGKITFWGEIDRQNLLPYGSTREIRQEVFEVWNHLHSNGGVIAQCEFGPGANPENVCTVFEAWEEIERNELPKRAGS
jgi:hypothetical protein